MITKDEEGQIAQRPTHCCKVELWQNEKAYVVDWSGPTVLTDGNCLSVDVRSQQC